MEITCLSSKELRLLGRASELSCLTTAYVTKCYLVIKGATFVHSFEKGMYVGEDCLNSEDFRCAVSCLQDVGLVTVWRSFIRSNF